MKKVLVIVNFNAGRKKAVLYKKKLQKFLFKNAESFKFITIEELEQINTSVFDTIIAMGGDGTVSRVVPYVLKNPQTALGIIPCGTANLLAEKLGIPQNINGTLKVLQKKCLRKIDIMKINDNIAVLRFGVGFDANIICKTPQSLKNKFGYFAYFIAGIIFALRLKNKTYKITTASEEKTVNASCIIVANAGNMYRNLISVAKNPKIDDGMLDIFVLKTTNPIFFFIELLKIALRKFSNSGRAEYFQTESILIENKWMMSHVDGEKQIFQEKIDISNLTSLLRVYTGEKR